MVVLGNYLMYLVVDYAAELVDPVEGTEEVSPPGVHQ
jgi:hypothetical protein